MLYVSWCILYVSYMYLKQRMEYIRIHTEYTTIHVSTPSHMARPVRLWDTPGYNRIQQNTSARVRIPTGCTQYLQIRPEYEEDLVSCHATFMCEDTFVFAPRVLYLDRIRWFPDSRTGIHPEYIRIHQNTSGYCIHRKPTQIS